MSILIPDGHKAYSEGYEKGKKDFLEGRGKVFADFFSKQTLIGIFSPGNIFGVDNRKYYLDQWNLGYTKGYEETQSLTNARDILQNKQDHRTTTKINTNMSGQTNYNYQIELLESLKSYLNGFQERLGAVGESYEKKVQELYDGGGMMEETFKTFYENYLEITKSKIQNLIDQINDSDIPFVEQQIENIESILDSLR
jgi:hypothetical protein